MGTREIILNRLRRQTRTAPDLVPWHLSRKFDDLTAQFIKALTAAGGEVHRASSLEAALQQVGDLITALDADRVVANHEPPLAEVDLSARWPQVTWHRVAPEGSADQAALRAFCAGADLGLSGAEGALAETGTVIVASGPGKSRLATLLPPVHLALVSASQLYADIFAWTAARSGELPANLTLISGPSKTADIEQTLAVGVHGPKRMIAVLYD
jgi:L-lactate dehydrogenase complex protein LldG